MNQFFNTILWQQFGAAIDMLENGVRACPDELWTASLWLADPRQPVWSQVWYNVYHCLFWLDLYLSGPEEGFMPPAPFTLIEMDPEGLVPDTVYSKGMLLEYLAYCRNKCRETIQALTDERAHEIIDFGNRAMPFAELQMYNMRHVQEHASQLALLLGQHGQDAAGWVSKAKNN